jgi:hypothetical protein
MAIVALLIAAGRGDPDLYRFGDPSALWLLVGPAIGFIAGLAVVLFTRFATARFAWARDLHASFRDLLGPLTNGEIFILASASSIGEELFFRGALAPWLGVWLQAGVFALLHVGPGRRFRRFLPWTLSAFLLGVAFAELTIHTGSLGGPIAGHFAINFFNLRFICTRDPGPETTRYLGSGS